jgi:S-adenosylmethionine:tRNA-ribosyltransferase-isomerase (queuine synthetase)
MKDNNIIRICRITKSSMASHYSSEVVLYRNSSNEYWLDVISDSEGLFEDMEIQFESDTTKVEAVKIFEEECINLFTCFNEFSIDEILEQGERIEFN